MTSYSNNGYDVTNYFCCYGKFLAYTLFLPGFIVVNCQMPNGRGRLGGGGLFAPSLRYRVKVRL